MTAMVAMSRQSFYDPSALARMRKLEEELRGYVAGRVSALSRP